MAYSITLTDEEYTALAAEEAKLDEIARRIRPGKPASEMVIEDRGPR